jgi:hypothetical protein
VATLRWMGVKGEVAKLLALLLATESSLDSNPDIIFKIIHGRHKQRSGLHTLARQKIYKQNSLESRYCTACTVFSFVGFGNNKKCSKSLLQQGVKV